MANSVHYRQHAPITTMEVLVRRHDDPLLVLVRELRARGLGYRRIGHALIAAGHRPESGAEEWAHHTVAALVRASERPRVPAGAVPPERVAEVKRRLDGILLDRVAALAPGPRNLAELGRVIGQHGGDIADALRPGSRRRLWLADRGSGVSLEAIARALDLPGWPCTMGDLLPPAAAE